MKDQLMKFGAETKMVRLNSRLSLIHFSLVVLASSVSTLFGLTGLINLLNIRFYHFHSLGIISITFFSPSLDWWIWCISLLVVIAEMSAMVVLYRLSLPRWMILPYSLLLASFPTFLIDSQVATFVTISLGFIAVGLSIHYGNGFLFARREEVAILVFVGIMGLLIPSEVASLCSWMLNAFDYEVRFGPGLRWRFPLFDLNLFNVLYPLTSWLLLILLLCWIWLPIFRYLSSRMRRGSSQSIHTAEILKKRLLIVALFITLAAAIFVAYYPYIHLPAPVLVGVDSIHYDGYLTRTIKDGPMVMLMYRPAFFLMLYLIKLFTMQPSFVVVRIMPSVCTVGLALATYWFVRTGTGNDPLALLSTIFSVFSFQTVAGMYGYILASWFLMIELMLFFTFLLKVSEKRSVIHSLIASFISIAAVLTHPTWLTIIGVIFFYIAIAILTRSESRRGLLLSSIPLLVISMTFAPFVLLKGVYDPSFYGYLSGIWNALKSSLDISKITLLQPSLSLMVQRWAGGGFGNPLMIGLAILGVATMSDLTKRFNRLILCWILVPSLAMLAVIPRFEDLYWRIAYVIPFQIPAAIGLKWLLEKLRTTLCNSDSIAAKTYFKLFQILLITLIMLLLFNYSLRTVDTAMIQMP